MCWRGSARTGKVGYISSVATNFGQVGKRMCNSKVSDTDGQAVINIAQICSLVRIAIHPTFNSTQKAIVMPIFFLRRESSEWSPRDAMRGAISCLLLAAPHHACWIPKTIPIPHTGPPAGIASHCHS